MAEPVGVFAQIHLTEVNYKAFFKTKAITVISEEMHQCILYNCQDNYCYQYNKKKEELLCLAFYNHGNRETIRGDFYLSIQTIAPFAKEGRTGVIALTLDAYNWQEIECYEVLVDNQWEVQAISAVELEALRVLVFSCLEHFDQPFAQKVFDSKMVDSNVVKKIATLQGKNRLANLTVFAKEATPLNPIHLFGAFYYNGKVVFSCKEGGIVYPQIDLATFKPMVYGACDQEHVIFNGKCIKTNPKKFKRVAKYETVYYLSEEGVLDEKGEWIEDSDATTFKLKEDYLAEDSIHLYYWGHVVSKSSFSTYRVESYPYQTNFLITDTAVYYSQYKLEVDAQSFRFLKRLEGLAYSYTGFVGEDKEGLFVYLIEENKGQVIRSTGLSIDQLLQLFQDKYGNKYWRMEEDERICLEKPSATYYKEFAKKCKTPWVFYQIKELRDYAKLIVQKYEDKKDEEELIPFWKIYSLVEPYLWIEADSYKYVTLMYCIEGKQEHALDTLRKAIMYGAFDMEEFFDHPLLSTIQEHEYFLELKEYAIQNKPIGYKIPMQLEILEKLLALPQSMYTDGTILWKYHLYDTVDIEEAMREHPQLTDYYTRYITLNTELFNRFFKRYNLIDMDYTPYEEYSCMPIEASIIMLKYYMRMADIPSGSVAYFIPQLIQRMDKIKERINRLTGEEYTHYQTMYNNNEVVQILEQYF